MRIMETLVRGQLVAQDGMRAVVTRLQTADDRGASALEYALLVGLILAAVVAGFRFLGGRATSSLSAASTALG